MSENVYHVRHEVGGIPSNLEELDIVLEDHIPEDGVRRETDTVARLLQAMR
jgi:hypothetical protein